MSPEVKTGSLLRDATNYVILHRNQFNREQYGGKPEGSKSKITQNFPEDPLFDKTGQKSLHMGATASFFIHLCSKYFLSPTIYQSLVIVPRKKQIPCLWHIY